MGDRTFADWQKKSEEESLFDQDGQELYFQISRTDSEKLNYEELKGKELLIRPLFGEESEPAASDENSQLAVVRITHPEKEAGHVRGTFEGLTENLPGFEIRDEDRVMVAVPMGQFVDGPGSGVEALDWNKRSIFENEYRTDRYVPSVTGLATFPMYFSDEPMSEPVEADTVVVADEWELLDFRMDHPNHIVAKIEKSGTLLARIVPRSAMASICKNARDGDSNFSAILREPEEILVSLFLKGDEISDLSYLRHFYLEISDIESIVAGNFDGEHQEGIVFAMAGDRYRGYYGFFPLGHPQALYGLYLIDERSKSRNFEELNLSHFVNGAKEFPFMGLVYRDTIQSRYLNHKYFQGKRAFFKEENLEKLDDFPHVFRDGFYREVGHEIFGEDTEAVWYYLEIEMARTEPDPEFYAIVTKHEVAGSLGKLPYTRAWRMAKDFLKSSLQSGIDQMQEFNSWDGVNSLLMLAASGGTQQKKAILNLFALEENEKDIWLKSMADMEKVAMLLQNQEVNGVDKQLILTKLQEQISNLTNEIGAIDRDEYDPLQLAGDAMEVGNLVRGYVFAKMGFYRLRPEDYPYSFDSYHKDDFSNLDEFAYAYIVHTQENLKTVAQILFVGAIVLGMVTLLLLAELAATALVSFMFADAIAAGGAFATFAVPVIETITAAVIFTFLETGTSYGVEKFVMGNEDAELPSLGEFAWKGLTNIFAFGIFKAFGAVAGMAGRRIAGLNAVSKVFKNTKATANVIRVGVISAGFISLAFHNYVKENGKWPEGKDLYMLLYENILFIALMEIGAKMMEPKILAIREAAVGKKRTALEKKLLRNMDEFQLIAKDIASLATRPESIAKESTALTKRLEKILKQQTKLLEQFEKQSWKYGHLAKAIRQRIELIEQMMGILSEAQLMQGIKMIPAEQRGDTIIYTYNPGEGKKQQRELLKMLRETFESNQGEKVSLEARSGKIVVETQVGKMEFVPEGSFVPEQKTGKKLSRREQLAQRKDRLVQRAELLNLSGAPEITALSRINVRNTQKIDTLKSHQDLIVTAEAFINTKTKAYAEGQLLKRMQKRFGKNILADITAGSLQDMPLNLVYDALNLAYRKQISDPVELRALVYAYRYAMESGYDKPLKNILSLGNKKDRFFILDTFVKMADAGIPGTWAMMRRIMTGPRGRKGGLWAAKWIRFKVGIEMVRAVEFDVDQSGVNREIDILLKDGTRVEMKDWDNWFEENVIKELYKDIAQETNGLASTAGFERIQWVFRAPGPVPRAVIERTFRLTLDKVIQDYGLADAPAKKVREAFENELADMLQIKDLQYRDYQMNWPDFQTGSIRLDPEIEDQEIEIEIKDLPEELPKDQD